MGKAQELRHKMVKKDPRFQEFLSKLESEADSGRASYLLTYPELSNLPGGILAALEEEGFNIHEIEDWDCVAGHEFYTPGYRISW